MKATTHTVASSSALRRLLLDHQIWCSADCCKSRAFQFTEDSILRWLDSERIDRTRAIAAEIAGVGADLQGVAGRVFMDVRGLESEWNADEFRTFWERFEAVYTQAIETRQRAGA